MAGRAATDALAGSRVSGATGPDAGAGGGRTVPDPPRGVAAAAAGVVGAGAASPGCRLAAGPPPQPAASSAAPRGSASNRSDFARDTGSVHRRPGDPAGRFVGRRLDGGVVLGRGAVGGLPAAVRPRRGPAGPAVDRAATGRGGEVVGALPVPVLDRGGGPVGRVAPL